MRRNKIVKISTCLNNTKGVPIYQHSLFYAANEAWTYKRFGYASETRVSADYVITAYII